MSGGRCGIDDGRGDTGGGRSDRGNGKVAFVVVAVVFMVV